MNMHIVFVDANVLGSKTLSDWLFMLRNASDGMYQLVSSDDVLDEAHRVWRKRDPEAGGDFRKRRAIHFRKNLDLIVDDWPGGPPPGKDKHDAHVHHAAVHANAHILLTSNPSDFGNPGDLPYELYTPDELFCLLYRNHPELIQDVAREQTAFWTARRSLHPDKTYSGLSDALVEAGCVEFGGYVYRCMQILSGVPEEDVIDMPTKILDRATA